MLKVARINMTSHTVHTSLVLIVALDYKFRNHIAILPLFALKIENCSNACFCNIFLHFSIIREKYTILDSS